MKTKCDNGGLKALVEIPLLKGVTAKSAWEAEFDGQPVVVLRPTQRSWYVFWSVEGGKTYGRTLKSALAGANKTKFTEDEDYWYKDLLQDLERVRPKLFTKYQALDWDRGLLWGLAKKRKFAVDLDIRKSMAKRYKR